MPAPIKGTHYLTQRYGRTAFAVSSGLYKAFGNIHPGLDFGTHGKHLDAISTIDGEVVMAKLDGGWGNHVGVLGADGWIRQYAHLHTMTVKVGDKVKTGDKLGTVGTTGASTGIHLHYGNRIRTKSGWQYRDPSDDLKPLPEVPEQKLPKIGLIKARTSPKIYYYTGNEKYHIPDMETLRTPLFAGMEWQELTDAIVAGIPEGNAFPSMK